MIEVIKVIAMLCQIQTGNGDKFTQIVDKIQDRQTYCQTKLAKCVLKGKAKAKSSAYFSHENQLLDCMAEN